MTIWENTRIKERGLWIVWSYSYAGKRLFVFSGRIRMTMKVLREKQKREKRKFPARRPLIRNSWHIRRPNEVTPSCIKYCTFSVATSVEYLIYAYDSAFAYPQTSTDAVRDSKYAIRYDLSSAPPFPFDHVTYGREKGKKLNWWI